MIRAGPQPEARSPQPAARSPQPEARSPKPEARSPKPEARSPKLFEIEIPRNPRAVLAERLEVHVDAALRFRAIVVVQIQVEQIDVPGRLHRLGHVALHDLARNRQGRPLRVVVDVAI